MPRAKTKPSNVIEFPRRPMEIPTGDRVFDLNEWMVERAGPNLFVSGDENVLYLRNAEDRVVWMIVPVPE